MKQESFKVSKKKLFTIFILIVLATLFITVMLGLLFKFDIGYSFSATIIIATLISAITNIPFGRKEDALIISDEKIILMSHRYSEYSPEYGDGTDSYTKKVVYKPYKIVEKLSCFIVIGKVEIINCNDFLHDNQKHGIDGGNKLRIWKIFNNTDAIRKLLKK